METKQATFQTRVNQSAIVKLFIEFVIDKKEIKVMRKSFMLFGLDKLGYIDINAFSEDHFYAQTPSQAAAMIRRFAKMYWPRDVENLESKFNTQYFQNFLKECLSSVSYKEEKAAFNADVEKFEQEFKRLLKKYNFNLYAYDGEGAEIYIQRDRNINGTFESDNAFLSLEDGFVNI